MGSGYFPLERNDEDAKTLLEAAAAVERIVNQFNGYDLSDQADNAASDGASLALLTLAIQLIRDEVRK